MFISKDYLLENGKEAPEGTIVCTCKSCKSEFAVPEAEAKQLENAICETCADKIDKAVAVAASSMITGGSEEAMEAINKALGK